MRSTSAGSMRRNYGSCSNPTARPPARPPTRPTPTPTLCVREQTASMAPDAKNRMRYVSQRCPQQHVRRRHAERLGSLEAVLVGVDAAAMKAATTAAARLDAVSDDVRRVTRRLDEACDASARAEAQHADRLAQLDGAVGEELRPAIAALRTQLEATAKDCRKAKHRGAEGTAALATAVNELQVGADATAEALRRIDEKLRRCVLDDMLDSERETILSMAVARTEPLRVSALLNASASEQHEHARSLERRLQVLRVPL